MYDAPICEKCGRDVYPCNSVFIYSPISKHFGKSFSLFKKNIFQRDKTKDVF